MQKVTESLAGRCAVLLLATLSADEVFAEGSIRDIDAFCWRSGFPELWQKPDLDRELWLGSYLATYLERDVRNVLRIGSLRDFDRFLRALALRAGQLLSLSDLARDVGISPNTAKNWISLLQASQQLFLLEPYHSNLGKRLIKTPKLYFADTGLLIYLLGFSNLDALLQHAMRGAVWENLVVSEVRKHFQNTGKRPPLWFWRTTRNEEIDLLIETGPRTFLMVECKSASEIEHADLSAFESLRRAYGPDAGRAGAVACRTDKPYPLAPKNAVMAVPLGGPDGLSRWIDRHLGLHRRNSR